MIGIVRRAGVQRLAGMNQITRFGPPVDELANLVHTVGRVGFTIAGCERRSLLENLVHDIQMIVHQSGIVVSGIQPLYVELEILVHEVVQRLAYLLGVLQGNTVRSGSLGTREYAQRIGVVLRKSR